MWRVSGWVMIPFDSALELEITISYPLRSRLSKAYGRKNGTSFGRVRMNGILSKKVVFTSRFARSGKLSAI